MPDVDRYRAAGTLRPRCEMVILGHGVALYRFRRRLLAAADSATLGPRE